MRSPREKSSRSLAKMVRGFGVGWSSVEIRCSVRAGVCGDGRSVGPEWDFLLSRARRLGGRGRTCRVKCYLSALRA